MPELPAELLFSDIELRVLTTFARSRTGALDAETGREIMQLLKQLNVEQGTAAIVVTHDRAVAAQCRRRLRLQDGALREHHSAQSAQG